VALFLLMVVAVSLFLAPFVLVAWHLSPMPGGVDWFTIILAQVSLVMIMRILVDHRFGHSAVFTLAHPAGISFMLLSTAFAAVKRITGGGVTWKQRRYTRT